MNERIKELAEQAQKVIGYTDGGYTEIKHLDTEKFAELIVQECVTEISKVKDQYEKARLIEDDFDIKIQLNYGEMACDASVKQINKHFGVA